MADENTQQDTDAPVIKVPGTTFALTVNPAENAFTLQDTSDTNATPLSGTLGELQALQEAAQVALNQATQQPEMRGSPFAETVHALQNTGPDDLWRQQALGAYEDVMATILVNSAENAADTQHYLENELPTRIRNGFDFLNQASGNYPLSDADINERTEALSARVIEHVQERGQEQSQTEEGQTSWVGQVGERARTGREQPRDVEVILIEAKALHEKEEQWEKLPPDEQDTLKTRIENLNDEWEAAVVNEYAGDIILGMFPEREALRKELFKEISRYNEIGSNEPLSSEITQQIRTETVPDFEQKIADKVSQLEPSVKRYGDVDRMLWVLETAPSAERLTERTGAILSGESEIGQALSNEAKEELKARASERWEEMLVDAYADVAPPVDQRDKDYYERRDAGLRQDIRDFEGALGNTLLDEIIENTVNDLLKKIENRVEEKEQQQGRQHG